MFTYFTFCTSLKDREGKTSCLIAAMSDLVKINTAAPVEQAGPVVRH